MILNNFINDCISNNDYLGYLPYVESFEYLICKHNHLINLPIVFGIHGKWGVGKSTFMRLIKNNLDQTENFFTIEINPWEFGSDQNFISVFLAKLYEQTKDEICNEEVGIEDPFTKFFKSIFKPLKLSAGIGIIKGEYDFSKLSFENQKNIIEDFISENFSMKKLIHDILNAEIFINKKIIVLIDDLDRCQPNKVIEVIESIKLVLDSQNCVFFLGCDKDYLESALSIEYQDFIKFLVNEEDLKDKNSNYHKSLKSFSREYLEKIIQIPFYIPPLDEKCIENFVDCILFNRNSVTSSRNIFEIDLYDEFVKKLNKGLISRLIISANLNPRRIKRILNLIFLNYIFLRFKKEEHIDGNIDVSLLSFLGFVRDVEQEYYINFLSNKAMCKTIFSEFYRKINESNENQDRIDTSEEKSYMLNQKIKEYFKIYFSSFQLSNEDLLTHIENIDTYITVSNITTSEDYNEKSLETIRNIRSNITNIKLEQFLDKIKISEVAFDIIIWFFGNVYDKQKFTFDLKSSISLFVKTDEIKDLNSNFLLRFEFNEKDNSLFIRFERLALKSIFFQKSEKLFLIRNYNKDKKHIHIPSSLNSKESNDIKKGLELIFSEI